MRARKFGKGLKTNGKSKESLDKYNSLTCYWENFKPWQPLIFHFSRYCGNISGGLLSLNFYCIIFSTEMLSLLFALQYQLYWASQVAQGLKNPPTNAGDIRDASLIPGSGWSHEGRHGNPLRYSYLENPMDRGAWQAMVHRAVRSQTRLKWLSTQARIKYILWAMYSFIKYTLTFVAVTVLSKDTVSYKEVSATSSLYNRLYTQKHIKRMRMFCSQVTCFILKK